MNDFDTLCESIRDRHREADMDITAPAHPDGVWWLNVETASTLLSIQWFEGRFGITKVTDDPLYTHQPDESFETVSETLKRIDELLN